MTPQARADLSFETIITLIGGHLGTHDVACPVCGPERHSPANRIRRVLRIYADDANFPRYHCARCGVRGWTRADGSNTIEPKQLRKLRAAAAKRDAAYVAKQHGKARYLWQQRQPIVSVVREYLEFRGIIFNSDPPATLCALPPLSPDHHPAMIAAFGFPDEPEPGILHMRDNAVRGVHLTLLAPNGEGKAGTGRDKIMIGPSAGWPIVLAPSNDGLGLVIAEGIEDALSAHLATGLGAWAAGSASRLPALADAVPDHIKCATVLVDDDEAGRKRSAALGERLAARGIEVRNLSLGGAAHDGRQ